MLSSGFFNPAGCRPLAGAPTDDVALIKGTTLLEMRQDTISEALAALAIEAAHAPAVVWATDRGADELTWSDLYDRARRGAATLLRLNPQRSRVAIAAMNSVEWIVAMYACTVAGMPVVPISASCTDEEARYQIDHARVGLIVAAVEAGGHRVLERMSKVAATTPTSPGILDINQIDSSSRVAPAATSPDDEFLVQYTSGTTGRPKAASISHRAVLNSAWVLMRAVGFEPGDRFLNPLPLHHVGGSVTGLIATLAGRGAYVLFERFSPQAVVQALRQTAPTIAGLVPTMMIDLLNLPGFAPADFASLRTVMSGATAVDPALVIELENRLGIAVIGSYGQSEAPAMIASAPDDPAEIRIQTLGRVLAGRDFCIRDRNGALLPIGTEGELCVRGPLTMSGYLNADGLIDPAVDTEGWRGTGDLCTMDEHGVVTFKGRIREVVIRGGLNVYPAEVEQALSTHPSLSAIAVFGVSDARLGERVIAAVVPASDAELDITELSALAEQRLSSYKRPAEWVVVAKLPRTSTGKIRKHLLREWHEKGVLNHECGESVNQDG